MADPEPLCAPIAVCVKWVSLRPDVDPLSGAVAVDARWSGASPADQAALEWALRIGEQRNADVIVVCVGPVGAETILRDALACGAHRALRIASDAIDAPTSRSVATALASVLAPLEPVLVLCGDWSLDRGSASVPVFLAAELGVAQACGLVSIDPQLDGSLVVERRLDGGRRERLLVSGCAVLSVEGVTAVLRRAPLRSMLAARRAPIDVCAATIELVPEPVPARTAAFRPRARILEAPTGSDPRSRVVALTGAMHDATPPQRLVLEPAAAADHILQQLHAWGYLAET